MTQEELFNDWNNKCDRLKNLSAFFQNDIERLYKDGYITSDDLITNLKEFQQLYSKCIDDIEYLSDAITFFHLEFFALHEHENE